MNTENNNELYHYGVLGMKWKNHKYVDYGNLRSNLSARIRRSNMSSTNKRIKSQSNELNQMNKYYEWMKKNNSNIQKSGSKIGNSKILTNIREHRMNKLKNKISNTKDSIKEDQQIMKHLTKTENNAMIKAKNKAFAKQVLLEAKNRYKESNKKYNKAFDKYVYGTPLVPISKNSKAANSENLKNMKTAASQLDIDREAYQKARKKYKNAKK